MTTVEIEYKFGKVTAVMADIDKDEIFGFSSRKDWLKVETIMRFGLKE